MVFWALAALLVVIALGVLLQPLVRPSRHQSMDRASLNAAIHEERLRELERDRDLGSLSAEEFDASRRELERALLEDVREPAAGTGPRPPGGGLRLPTAAVLGVFLPVAAVALYMNLGEPQVVSAGHGAPPGAAAGGEDAPSLEDMVARLVQRLESEPENLEGWVMLGRSYQVMERHRDALEAYAKARALAPDDPDVNVRYAEALALSRGGDLQGEPAQVLQQVLARDANHPMGLWLAGVAAQQGNDLDQALVYWNRLRPLLEGEERAALEQVIAQTGGAATGAPAAVPPAQEPVAAAAGGSLRVRVALGADLAGDARPGDTVFIFARAADGPRMPLAVVRRTVADLPTSVELDDSQAMTEQFRLSNFPQVVVGARVSRGGQPTPQPGDLEGLSDAVTPGSPEPISVTIDRRI